MGKGMKGGEGGEKNGEEDEGEVRGQGRRDEEWGRE